MRGLNYMRKIVYVRDIIQFLNEQNYSYEFNGNNDDKIEGISSLTKYKAGTMTWIRTGVENIDLSQWVSLLVTSEETKMTVKAKNRLIVEDPKLVFFEIVTHFFYVEEEYAISKLISIPENTEIDQKVSIGTGCIVEENVKIGEGTRIYNNVVIKKNTTIGKNCLIKSGAIIGEEGFGYYNKEGIYIRVPHMGSVIIEDKVEIGANTCIDKGTLGDTLIGSGTKIDNLCHIAHNVIIGNNTWIIAGTIIGGSAVIGDNTKLSMNVTVRDGVKIAQDCMIGMGSVVTKNFSNANDIIFGNPAKSSNGKV